ncbi:hypothetical protein AMTR_s00163p00017290 [Amborella trichopoda]|uniref:Aminotransferase-like plant mobile domain-containing protein n=1 Tax=Amborella trichopoda TaxID=13333 RepID=W1PPD0_AMBTC|nr:hypothetical protein AMTR_s00163p00017290 [Amborella trichopoda]
MTHEDDLLYMKDDHVWRLAVDGLERNKIYIDEGFSITQHWRLIDEQEDLVRRTGLWHLVPYTNMEGAPRQIDHDLMEASKGNEVPIRHLTLFEDFDAAGWYAWGLATLAYLFRGLKKSVSVKIKRGRQNVLNDVQAAPGSHLSRYGYLSISKHCYLKEAVDGLKLVYQGLQDGYTQVLRQFGMRQPIPTNPDRWEIFERWGKNEENWEQKLASQIRDWHDRLQYRQIGEQDSSRGLPSKEYEAWYVQVSIPIIHNSQNPRMNVYAP